MLASRLMTLDYGSIRLFALIAARGSIAAAARETGVSTPTATRRLAAMETALDARLFNRSTRQLGLTEAGRAALDWAEAAIGDLDRLAERVSSVTGAPAGTVRVATPHFGMSSYLPQVFATFLESYPDIGLDLTTTDASINLIADGFDLALHYGALPDSRLISVRLNGFQRIVCASPLYLARFGRPERIEELARHRCILHRPSDRVSWSFRQGEQLIHQPVRAAITTDNALSLNPLCRAGAGIARLTLPAAQQGLDDGSLNVLFQDYDCVEPTGNEASLWLIHIGKDLPQRVRLLVNHLKQEVPIARRRFYESAMPPSEGADAQ